MKSVRTYSVKFSWLVLYPLVILFTLSAAASLYWLCGFFALLFVDGVIGLIRSENYKREFSRVWIITDVKEKFFIKDFSAIMLFGTAFTKQFALGKRKVNHLTIHKYQWIEVGFFLFYVLYICEFLFRLLLNWKKPEKIKLSFQEISFEREARKGDDYTFYMGIQNQRRIPYVWLTQLKDVELEMQKY